MSILTTRFARAIALTSAIAVGGAFLLGMTTVSFAGQSKMIEMSFKAMPKEMRWKCERVWKGKFWMIGPRYGCNERRFRTDCLRGQCERRPLDRLDIGPGDPSPGRGQQD